MAKHSGNRLNSSVVIAKLLDSEGFSDHVANIVERYWLKNVCRPGGRKKYRQLDTEMSAMCLKLTDAERLILGKFIATHKRMSFDTGLRIGLTAFARKEPKDYIEGEVQAEVFVPGMKVLVEAEVVTTTNAHDRVEILMDTDEQFYVNASTVHWRQRPAERKESE